MTWLLLAVLSATQADDAGVLPERIVLAADARTLAAVLADHPGVTVQRRFESFAGVVVSGGEAALDALSRDSRVRSQHDLLGHPMTDSAAAFTGAREVQRSGGLLGRGVRVAVLDTGVDRTHPDLDAGVVATKCFVLGGCPPMNGDTGELAPDVSGHGTHVSGIITSDGKASPRGVAPEAEVVAVRVFNQQSVGRVSDWVAALDWVYSQRADSGVRLVNMSLGTNMQWPRACDAEQPALTEVVARLEDAGIAVFAASGNEMNANGLTAPACVSGVLSVGAVYDEDLGREPDTGGYPAGCFDAQADAGSIVCFSNSGEELDLLAPGARIRSSVPGGGAGERRGTSQATPHAAAIAALVLEQDPRLSVRELEAVLEQTGRPITDARNGRATPIALALPAVTRALETLCTRRENGAVCERARSCEADGGPCTVATGTCFDGACVLTTPAFDGAFPAQGCTSVTGALGLVGALVLAWWAARR